MALSVGYGILFAIISLLCNGSFSSLNKIPSVVKCRVDAQIFNLYFIIGCCFSCIIVYLILIGLHETITITYLGIISGFLLSLSGIATFSCINHIGLAVGVAIWSGTAILVSFIEGLLIDQHLYSWPMAIIGIIILLIGITITSFSELLAQICCATVMMQSTTTPINDRINHHKIHSKYSSNQSQGIPSIHQDPSDTSVISSYRDRESQTLLSPQDQSYILALKIYTYYIIHICIYIYIGYDTSADVCKLREDQNIINDTEIEIYDEEVTATKWFLGIFYAILAGIFGGSVGFPSIWTDSNNSDAKYLISFAIGTIMVFPITWLSECFFRENPLDKIKWEFKTCFIPGFISGIIWNGGNLASLYAIQILGYSVAYPIMQSSLIIASCWGVFIWKEFTNKYVISFIFLGAITVIAGCALITYGVDA